MPVKLAHSTDDISVENFACLRRFRRFRAPASEDGWQLAGLTATSDDLVYDEDEADLNALRDAIASSTDTISYEQFRQELGLH